MGRLREQGSAVLAAVMAAACFALVAAQLARSSRSDIQSANAEVLHGRLAADADAGLALAAASLSGSDANARWGLDRQVHTFSFNGATLDIVVEDERGKVPINTITQQQVETLFQKAGADPAAVSSLVEGFLDYRDPNRARSNLGASITARATTTATPSAGGFTMVEELAGLPGMTPGLYNAIAGSVTTTAGDAAFDTRTATPLALEVMKGAFGTVDAIERQREANGQRTAFQDAPAISLVGRTLTIRVRASEIGGSDVEKTTIIQLTGQPSHPYVVRQVAAGYG